MNASHGLAVADVAMASGGVAFGVDIHERQSRTVRVKALIPQAQEGHFAHTERAAPVVKERERRRLGIVNGWHRSSLGTAQQQQPRYCGACAGPQI